MVDSERAACALTVSFTTLTDTDAPTATLLPAAEALVVSSNVPISDAETSTLPPPAIADPVPT